MLPVSTSSRTLQACIRRVGFGQQRLQDLRAEPGIAQAAVEIERVDLDLVVLPAKADAAHTLVAQQDQAHAGFIEMSTEHPPRA